MPKTTKSRSDKKRTKRTKSRKTEERKLPVVEEKTTVPVVEEKPAPVKIDDQFAKNLGAKDLNDLKQMVTSQIKNQYKMNLDALAKENILNQIEKLHDIDLPENLIEQELALISQNLKKEEAEKNKNEREKIAKKRVKLGLILNELGENNNLKVSEDELRNEIQKQVQSMPGQQKQILEYYQKNPSATLSLRGSIYEEKIINLIKEKSKKIQKPISINEAEEIIKKQSQTEKQVKLPINKSKEPKKKKSSKKLKKLSNLQKIRKKLEKTKHKLYNFNLLIRYEK